MKNSVMAAVMMVVVMGGVALGSLTYSGAVQYSAGSGCNTAYVAVDFNYGNAFVFEYKWDGAATGWNALQAVVAAGALDMAYTDYGSMGILVDNLTYPGGTKISYSDPYAGWAYFNSSNGENWGSSGSGVSRRPLVNGAWDSWVWTDWAPDYSASRQPGSNPIPEPMTLAMLGLGMVLVVRKK